MAVRITRDLSSLLLVLLLPFLVDGEPLGNFFRGMGNQFKHQAQGFGRNLGSQVGQSAMNMGGRFKNPQIEALVVNRMTDMLMNSNIIPNVKDVFRECECLTHDSFEPPIHGRRLYFQGASTPVSATSCLPTRRPRCTSTRSRSAT